MPSILCIAYLFPPRAGVGVQRITKFVRYLPEFGWTPIVLTPKKPAGSFPIDEGYLKEIPDSVKVYTAPSIEPYHIYRALGGTKRQDSADFRGVLEGGKKLGTMGKAYTAFQAACLIPDPKIGWFGPAVRKARKIVRENEIAAIFSTSPEATDHVIARAVARETGKPWVMDFRDPWTTSLYAIKRPPRARKMEDTLELSCLREASAVTVVQERYRDEYLEKYPVLKPESGKFRVLANGFDPRDFEGIKPRPFDQWCVVYTGSISYPRDPEPFFKAWKIARDKSEEFRYGAGCLFMGEFDSRFHALAPSYIMNGLGVESFRPREEVYSAQIGAGALLLISEGYVTGKVYEYLASRRPILALTDGADLKELVGKSGAGLCVSPGDIDEIARTLLDLFQSRSRPFTPDTSYIARFDRKHITGELADLLNDLIDRHV
jgi:glycosyltransferase involved in cell wall biosynthesis